jgi:uncharacterized membrane protein
MTTHSVRAPHPLLRPAVVAALSVVAVLAAAAAVDPVVRVIALLLFLIFGPGLALVGLLRLRDVWRELSLVIGVSLALDLVVVSAFVYGGNRSSGTALAVLIGIAVIGAVGQVLRRAPGQGAVS